MSKIAIKLEKVTKKFDDDLVLKDINCEFDQGKIHGLVGNNGSGKTVLLKCIIGLQLVTSGTVIVEEKVIGVERDFPESLGALIESPGFLPSMTGISNLKLLASINHKVHSKEVVESMLRVGLEPMSKKKVGKYSLGMRERLGIAQAIMEKPRILIFDEPFNGLDKNGTRKIRNLIKDINERGATVLLTSHNSQDIDSLCHDVYEMDAGMLTKIK